MQQVACLLSVARVAKSMNMTVWGLVRTIPPEEKKSAHVDAYRLVNVLVF